jgi:tetratricopeptide (TPR) repeat protein
MLCPNCKNEKWNEEVCPRCGMDPQTALLSKADLYQQEGRHLDAARYYEDYLKLEPGQWDVVRKKAVALYGAALKAQDKNSFTKADQALAEALEQEWDWEQGHQFRVNLSYEYGRLEDIKDQYERAAAQTPARKGQAEKAMKIILLTERFAAPSDEEKAASPKKSWISSDWITLAMVLAVPLWLWFLARTLFPSTATATSGGTFLLVGTFCAGGLVLFFVVRFFRKQVKTGASAKRRETTELNPPPR